MDDGGWWRWRVVEKEEVYNGMTLEMRKLCGTSSKGMKVEN